MTCALVAQAPCLPLGAFPPTLTSGHVGRVFHSTTLRDGLFFAGIIASKELGSSSADGSGRAHKRVAFVPRSTSREVVTTVRL